MSDFLHLNGWKTLAVHESENDYHVEAEIIEAAQFCPHCLKFTELVKFGTRKQMVLDSPVRGKRVGIHFSRQRFRCVNCCKISLADLPSVSDTRRTTARLELLIGRKSLIETFSAVAREVGLTDMTVRRIFGDWVEKQNRFWKPITPDILGIDEINIIRPRCVLSNIGENTICDILPKRNKTDVIARLDKMETSKVKIVAIDMWRPYREAVEVVIPKAIVVIDKFHVVRLANNCMETVRKQIRSTLSEHYRLQLKNDRFLLLKRRSKLDDFQKLTVETWTNQFPLLGEVYEAKEKFFDFYECQTRLEAEIYLREWKNSLSEEAELAFKPLLTALHNWRGYILNYFDTPKVTNAYTESLNSLIRLVSRNGRGYSFDVLRAKILYSPGVRKMKTYAQNQKETGILYSLPMPTEIEDFGASISTLVEKFGNESK